MKGFPIFSLLVFLGLSSHYCDAQSVYRWVDEDGNVHYGDRPPQSHAVEDISDDIQNTNVDTSADERRKMGKIFAKETEAEKRAREQQRRQQEVSEHNRQVSCDNARKRLQFLEENPFYIVEPDGTERDVSMKERDQMMDKQRAVIRDKCH